MGKKDIFFDLRQLTNLIWQWRVTWRKLNLSCTYFNSLEGQESCDSLVKNDFLRATFRKFGTSCDHIRKNTEASRNCCIIYLKSKHSCEHCIYKENWLNSKPEEIWYLFVCAFISLLLLLFLTIVFICFCHVDPNWFPYVLCTLNLA